MSLRYFKSLESDDNPREELQRFFDKQVQKLVGLIDTQLQTMQRKHPGQQVVWIPIFDAKTSSLTVAESSHPSWRTRPLPVRTKPTSCPILERRRPLQRCEYSSPSGSRSTTGRLQRSRWRSASEAEGWPASAEVSLLPCVVWDHLQRAVQQGQSAAQGAFNVQRPHERQGICNAEYCLVYQKGDGARTILLIWCLRARY